MKLLSLLRSLACLGSWKSRYGCLGCCSFYSPGGADDAWTFVLAAWILNNALLYNKVRALASLESGFFGLV